VWSALLIWNDSEVSCHFQGRLKAVDGLRMPRWWHMIRVLEKPVKKRN
jgi:hypothetical protein